jgi:threonine aldolase
MNDRIVDLRSDTVTRPTEAMRRSMFAAPLGDDVLGDDPTVRALEEESAAAVGKDAALFVPSGTMGNQLAIHLQARHGDEVILERDCHIANYELAGMAALSGTMPRTVVSASGIPDAAQLAAAYRSGHPYDEPRTALLAIENTHMLAGGVPHAPAACAHALAFAREKGIPVHLDGARLFNAAVALGLPASALAEGFSTVMFCFSKGLGAPIGSCLAGNAALIEEARKVRKRWGGGMRQAGLIAAGALHGLRHHVARLAEDHARARRLAEGIAGLRDLEVSPDPPPTNIVMVRVPPGSGERIRSLLEAEGVLSLVEGGRIRLVTHLDVDDAGVERAIAALRAVSRAA